jgi:hypothetical protein
MKALQTLIGNFGPYRTIEMLDDRYRCDDTDLPFNVVGKGIIVNANTITWPSNVVPPTETEIITAMEALFDKTAQSKRYHNRLTCALRAGYPGPFQAEGIAFATWMDSCNAVAYQMQAEIKAGTRTMPTTIEEALSFLPAIVWP